MTKHLREQAECERSAQTGNHVGDFPEKFPGQRAMALSVLFSENGLPDLPIILIEPHRNQQGVLQIKFCYADNEPISMNSVQASVLAGNLHQLDEVQLADEIDGALRDGVAVHRAMDVSEGRL